MNIVVEGLNPHHPEVVGSSLSECWAYLCVFSLTSSVESLLRSLKGHCTDKSQPITCSLLADISSCRFQGVDCLGVASSAKNKDIEEWVVFNTRWQYWFQMKSCLFLFLTRNFFFKTKCDIFYLGPVLPPSGWSFVRLLNVNSTETISDLRLYQLLQKGNLNFWFRLKFFWVNIFCEMVFPKRSKILPMMSRMSKISTKYDRIYLKLADPAKFVGVSSRHKWLVREFHSSYHLSRLWICEEYKRATEIIWS